MGAIHPIQSVTRLRTGKTRYIFSDTSFPDTSAIQRYGDTTRYIVSDVSPPLCPTATDYDRRRLFEDLASSRAASRASPPQRTPLVAGPCPAVSRVWRRWAWRSRHGAVVVAADHMPDGESRGFVWGNAAFTAVIGHYELFARLPCLRRVNLYCGVCPVCGCASAPQTNGA